MTLATAVLSVCIVIILGFVAIGISNMLVETDADRLAARISKLDPKEQQVIDAVIDNMLRNRQEP
jgi:hypothetical protein